MSLNNHLDRFYPDRYYRLPNIRLPSLAARQIRVTTEVTCLGPGKLLIETPLAADLPRRRRC